eukprot:gene46-12860_t
MPTQLQLQTNSLTGTLPSEWGPALSLLQQANLASNQLYDTIPTSWAAGMTVMSSLVLTNNVGRFGTPYLQLVYGTAP